MNPLSAKRDSAADLAEKLLDQKPAREVILHQPTESFRWLSHDFPAEIAKWQRHPEVEIHLIRKSHGSYIIGDAIGAFGPGQVSIVGSNVPHDWVSDVEPGEFFKDRDGVIQFLPEWVDKVSETVPEIEEVKKLIKDANRGIIFHGKTQQLAAAAIERVGQTSGLMRMQAFLAVLAIMANAPEQDKEYVTRPWVENATSEDATAAVEAGLKYILQNLNKEIRMSEAARLAHMSEPTFSKYFKRASGFTFSESVRKLRIAQACRLLDRTNKSIRAICQASGYTNLANFNRQFMAEIGMTPSAYRSLGPEQKPRSTPLSLNVHSNVDVRDEEDL